MTLTQKLVNGRIVTTDTLYDPAFGGNPDYLVPLAPPDPPPNALWTNGGPGPWLSTDSAGNLYCFGNLVFSVNSAQFNPSGDETGATDAAAIQAAINAGLPIRLAAGTFYVNATLAAGLNNYIFGAGMSATIISLTSSAGAVPCVKFSASSPSLTEFAGIYNLTVSISSATAGSSGVQVTNIFNFRAQDVAVQDTSSDSTNIGWHFLNDDSHSEQARVRGCYSASYNCVVFDVTGTDPSFDRGEFDFNVEPNNVQGNGILWKNGALQRGGGVRLRGNFSGNPSTNTGVVMGLSGTGASLVNVNLDVSVEADGSDVGPQTINFGAASNTISGYGSVDFLNSGSTFQASNNNGQFTLTGTVTGDTALEVLTNAAVWDLITTGFPSGWSGTVGFQKLAVSDEVMILVDLTIASSTVVDSSTTILSTIPVPYQSNSSLGASVFTGVQEDDGTWSCVPFFVTSSGALVYLGAGFTASGTSRMAFYATYSNSQ